MLQSFAPFSHRGHVSRRAVLGAVGIAALATPFVLRAQESSQLLNIGLTPVFLNDDLGLLSALKTYLEAFTARPVKLVLRRTYQEITGLLLSGGLDAAWICGYPYVTFRDRLDLLAVPLWRGKPVYQSYLIAGASSRAASVEDLRGGVHAFSRTTLWEKNEALWPGRRITRRPELYPPDMLGFSNMDLVRCFQSRTYP